MSQISISASVFFDYFPFEIGDKDKNTIDVFSRMQMEELILKFKPTMILVEHDRTFMQHTATRIINI